MNHTVRYQLIREQHAYARRVAAFGLPALLAPYTLRRPVVPAQRRRVVAREKVAA